MLVTVTWCGLVLVSVLVVLQAISAGGWLVVVLLVFRVIAVVSATLPAASVVNLRMRLVATGEGRGKGGEGGEVAGWRVEVEVMGRTEIRSSGLSVRSAGPPQLTTHSCIVAKLFSLPVESSAG